MALSGKALKVSWRRRGLNILAEMMGTLNKATAELKGESTATGLGREEPTLGLNKQLSKPVLCLQGDEVDVRSKGNSISPNSDPRIKASPP